MCRGCFWLVLCLPLTGCFNPPTRSTSWLPPLRSPAAPPNDLVTLEVMLVETQIGNRFLNEEVWNHSDETSEQVVALERKGEMNDNGFRLGLLGAVPPAGLQSLLRGGRNYLTPRCMQVTAGEPAAPLHLGPSLARCSYRHPQEESNTVELTDAVCSLQIIPTPLDDGRLRLRLSPQVRHGVPHLTPAPAPDRSGWITVTEQPTETYPNLTWDVTISPEEYLLLGTRHDRPGTLGHQCFVRTDEAPPVQRLLVLRARRAALARSTPVAEFPGDPLPRALPLAMQASFAPVVRGSGK
jgi:hypothetical protein